MCEPNGNINKEVRNQKEILELKSTKTEMKIFIQIFEWKFHSNRDSNTDFSRQEQRFVKLEEWKLSRLWTEREKTEEKWTDPKEPVGYHQSEEHMHLGVPVLEEREKRQREYLKK